MTQTRIADWVIDPAHSTFEFAVRHMRVSTIKGAFSGVSGEIHYDPDSVEGSSVRAEIDMSTIDTHNANRDERLRGESHFNVAEFPTATFVSKRVEPRSDERFDVVGDLTLHGVTREVVFDTVYEGVQELPNGAFRAAFTALTTIGRLDFGFAPGNELPGGGYTVSDEVQLAMYTSCNPASQE